MEKNKTRFLVLIALIVLSGFIIASLVSFFISRSAMRERISNAELPLTTDNIYSEIQRDLLRPVFVSSLMAHDTFLRDWIMSGEKNELQIRRYLSVIQEKYNTFTSFLVSEKTGIYYQTKGILKTVRPGEKRDQWYYRVRNMPEDYEINVDIDMANNDKMAIFVNHKVFDYNGNFIGATGVGLNIHRVGKLVRHYEDKYQRNIFFIDREGRVMLSGKHHSTVSNITEAEGISGYARSILKNKELNQSFYRNGSFIQFSSRYIKELKWFVVVEQSEEMAMASLYRVLYGNLVLSLVVTFFTVFLVNIVVSRYQKSLLRKDRALEHAQKEIKKLSEFLPICSSCKKIRDENGQWFQVEEYFSKHSDTQFSHGICPECAKKLYPDLMDE